MVQTLTVVITGAGRGIGWELSNQYLAGGHRVIATCRTEEARLRLTLLGENVEVVGEVDVRTPDAAARLAGACRDRPIDVLIHNAGIMGPDAQTLDAMDYDAWSDVFATNVHGPFRLTMALLPNLRLSARPRVVTLSSIMGCLRRKSVGYYAYRSSKAAVNKVMQLLANELEEEGVIVVPVHPGWVQTEMGGEGAELPVADSAAGLIKLVDGLELEHSGRFWQWDGSELAW